MHLIMCRLALSLYCFSIRPGGGVRIVSKFVVVFSCMYSCCFIYMSILVAG